MREASKRVLLVTGGGRGIGAATARLSAARDYSVCVNYRRDRGAAEQVVNEIERAGGRAIAARGDVSLEADVLEVFETAQRELGPIAALVNNAGVLARQMSLADMELDRLERIFATNITGTFLCAREAVRRMSISRGGAGGAIVNVSSAAARLGGSFEYVDYAASKGAVDTFTIGLAKEVAGDGIRVNAVRPGVIHTDIHASGGEPGRVERVAAQVPMKRGGTAEEVAQTILWLLSDEASYCTGCLLDVAGGR
jgi:NAD(P)-dependent dehydrogenase (short-subunit alcohol dehydrogenase family)